MAAAVLVLVLLLASPVSAQVAAPAGQITLAATITLAPTWFDPAETPGVITPFLTLVYEFVLRKGVRFHNGDALTAEDVKSSFERYKGGGASGSGSSSRGPTS